MGVWKGANSIGGVDRTNSDWYNTSVWRVRTVLAWLIPHHSQNSPKIMILS